MKTTNLFTLLLFSLFFQSIYGQETQIPKTKTWKMGLSMAPEYTFATYANALSRRDPSDPAVGFSSYLIFERQYTPVFSLQLGAGLSKMGYSYQTILDQYNSYDKFSKFHNYFDVPINAVLKSNKNKVNPFLKLGVTFSSYLFSQDIEREELPDGIFNRQVTKERNDNYHSLLLNVQAAIGFEFKNQNERAFRLTAEYRRQAHSLIPFEAQNSHFHSAGLRFTVFKLNKSSEVIKH